MDLPGPIVMLFGAGATRAAFNEHFPPPPLDADFFEIANQLKGRGTGKLAKQVAKDVFDLYGKVVGIGLEQYYRDIETRLELSKFAKTQNKPKDWKKRTANLEELVRRVLIHTTCTMDDGSVKPRRSKIHESLLGVLDEGDTVLTFNYDTVIEESAPTSGCLWSPNGGYGLNVSGVTHEWAKNWRIRHNVEKSEQAKIELLKLHGSLNWQLYQTSVVRLKQRPYVVRTRNNKVVHDKAAFLPPGHKRVDLNPYNSLWHKARLKLDRCASLVIVGYSLPETDLIARALFLEVNRLRRARGSYLKELHVADVNPAAIGRIVDLFLPAIGHQGAVFRYGGAKEMANSWKSQGVV